MPKRKRQPKPANALQQKRANNSLRIGIDCRLSGRTHAGIGRYIKHLVQHLLTVDTATTYVLFFATEDQRNEVLDELKKPSNVEVVYLPVSHYSLKEQLKLPQKFAAAKLDLLHIPHFNIPLLYSGKLVVTIHDLLWHEQRGSSVTTLPAWQYWPKYLLYRFVVSQAVRRAQTILVPSSTVKNTIEQYYPDASTKTLVTPEAPSPTLTAHRKKIRRVANQLLYVGSLYPHKNVSVILDALLLDPRYTLRIVSARTIFEKRFISQIEKRHLSERVTLLGSVTEKELSHEYQSCMALIQPSKSEGFGLTGVEAMSFGTPVVASNIAVFHEIYKRGAVYFNPDNPESLLRQLKAVQRRRTTLQKRALKQSESYSWDSLATKTLSVYRSAAQS